MPIPALALPAIGAGAQALGGIVQGALGYGAQKRTNEANMELAKYAYKKDLEMWNKGNLYNSPQAQMERLKSAGLNPALVYGSGAVANSSGQLPKYNAPTMDYNYVPPVQSTMANTIGAYQDFQIKQAQASNLREQGKILAEEAKIRGFKNWLNEQTGSDQASRWRLGNENLFSTSYWRDKLGHQAETKARLGNELFEDTYNEQVGVWQNRYKQGTQNLATGRINQRAKLKAIEAMSQSINQKGQMFPFQMDYQRGKINQINKQIENMEIQGDYMKAQQEYKQLEIDTFMYQLYGGFAEKAMRAMEGMRKTYRGQPTGKQGQSKAPWATTLKVNPRRRVPSKGAVNP